MPAPDIVGQNFEALTGYIGGIDPAGVREELHPFLSGDASGIPLSAIVSKFQIDPADPEDPIANLLGTVREKIGQLDPEETSSLAIEALGSVSSVFNRREFKPVSFEAVEALMEEADKFAELIGGEPERKAEYYLRTASLLARMDLSATGFPESFFGVAMSGQYLDKAVRVASTMDSDKQQRPRVRIMSLAAAESVSNIEIAAKIATRADGEDQELPPYVYEHPRRLYHEAFATADTMKDCQAFYELQIDGNTSAAGIIPQAAEIWEVSSDMHSELLSLALERMDKILTDHESGIMAASLHPRWHAYILAHMGQDILMTLGQQYDHGEGIEVDNEPLITRLEDCAFTLLRAAAEKVQALEEPGPEHEDQMPDRSSPNIGQAARVFTNRDPAKVTEIMGLAFATAIAEDLYEAAHERPRSVESVGLVLKEVRLLASQERGRQGVKNALALYAHMHGLMEQADAEGHFGKGTAHHFMSENADNLIERLERNKRELVRLNDVSNAERALLTFIIKERCTNANLEMMSSVIGDEELQQLIRERRKLRQEADAKAKAEREAPRTQIDRLSRELVRTASRT